MKCIFLTSTRKTPARVKEYQGQGGPTWPLVEDPDPDPVQLLSLKSPLK